MKGRHSFGRVFVISWFLVIAIMSFFSGETDRFVLFSMIPVDIHRGKPRRKHPIPVPSQLHPCPTQDRYGCSPTRSGGLWRIPTLDSYCFQPCKPTPSARRLRVDDVAGTESLPFIGCKPRPGSRLPVSPSPNRPSIFRHSARKYNT